MDFNKEFLDKYRNYRFERNELKKKKYLITPYYYASEKNIYDLAVRPYILACAYARYYRSHNYNVLYPINFNSLNSSYFSNIKYEHLSLNNYFYNNYLNTLVALNIGFDLNYSNFFTEKESILKFQQLFFYLYDNKLIKYEEDNVFLDNESNLYLDRFQTTNYNIVSKDKNIYLDYSKYIDKIIINIDKILIDEELKKEFKTKLGLKTTYYLNLYTKNNKEIVVKINKLHEVGALAAILVGIDNIDILEYLCPSKIFLLEQYYENDDSIYFDTANYVINPLTGRKIPLFLSKIDKGFIPLYNNEADKKILDIIEEEPINILDSNYLLINSDFLDGMTISQAANEIKLNFIPEGLITVRESYEDTKILITKNEEVGLLVPIIIENNIIFKLNNNIPIYYDQNFNIINKSSFNLLNKTLNESYLNLFSYIISIYDNNLNLDENIINITKLLNEAVIFYNYDNSINEVLLPIIFLSILEQNHHIELLNNLEFIEIKPSFDLYSNKLKKENNNLIDYKEIICSYQSDALRLYLLSINNKEPFYFYKDNIFKYRQLIFEIEKLFDYHSDYNLSANQLLYKFEADIIEDINNFSFDKLINNISCLINNLKNAKVSLEQLKIIVYALYFVAPKTSAKLNNIYYKDKIINI